MTRAEEMYEKLWNELKSASRDKNVIEWMTTLQGVEFDVASKGFDWYTERKEKDGTGFNEGLKWAANEILGTKLDKVLK